MLGISSLLTKILRENLKVMENNKKQFRFPTLNFFEIHQRYGMNKFTDAFLEKFGQLDSEEGNEESQDNMVEPNIGNDSTNLVEQSSIQDKLDLSLNNSAMKAGLKNLAFKDLKDLDNELMNSKIPFYDLKELEDSPEFEILKKWIKNYHLSFWVNILLTLIVSIALILCCYFCFPEVQSNFKKSLEDRLLLIVAALCLVIIIYIPGSILTICLKKRILKLFFDSYYKDLSLRGELTRRIIKKWTKEHLLPKYGVYAYSGPYGMAIYFYFVGKEDTEKILEENEEGQFKPFYFPGFDQNVMQLLNIIAREDFLGGEESGAVGGRDLSIGLGRNHAMDLTEFDQSESEEFYSKAA